MRIDNFFEGFKITMPKTLVQINYEFHLLPYIHGDINSIDDLQYGLEKVLDKKFHVEHLKEYLLSLRSRRENYITKHHSGFPYEVCFTGFTRSLVCKNYKQFNSFDYQKYLEQKEIFIRENPNYQKECECLFNDNINAICAFYLITEKQLKTNKFNKLEQSIKRLNIKINNHATS